MKLPFQNITFFFFIITLTACTQPTSKAQKSDQLSTIRALTKAQESVMNSINRQEFELIRLSNAYSNAPTEEITLKLQKVKSAHQAVQETLSHSEALNNESYEQYMEALAEVAEHEVMFEHTFPYPEPVAEENRKFAFAMQKLQASLCYEMAVDVLKSKIKSLETIPDQAQVIIQPLHLILGEAFEAEIYLAGQKIDASNMFIKVNGVKQHMRDGVVYYKSEKDAKSISAEIEVKDAKTGEVKTYYRQLKLN